MGRSSSTASNLDRSRTRGSSPIVLQILAIWFRLLPIRDNSCSNAGAISVRCAFDQDLRRQGGVADVL